jgi:hypothetical protein
VDPPAVTTGLENIRPSVGKSLLSPDFQFYRVVLLLNCNMTVEDEHKSQMDMTEDAEKGEARQQQDVRWRLLAALRLINPVHGPKSLTCFPFARWYLIIVLL